MSCETPQALGIEYCSENAFAAERATECVERLEKVIRDAGPELARIYSGETEQYLNNQKKEFHVSNGDHDRAHAKLTELIDMSVANLRRIAAYPPVMRDYDPADLENPSDHAVCYTDNHKIVKLAVEKLDQMITELKDTREVTDGLRRKISVSSGNIENLSTGLLERLSALGSARTKHAGSDVTGVKEDKEKRAGARGVLTRQAGLAREEFTQWEVWRAKEAEKLEAYLSAPERKAALAGRASAISKSEALEIFSPRSDARDFEAELGAATRAPASLSNETAQREAPSVGAFLFQEASTGSSSVKLALKEDPASASASVKPLGVLGEGEFVAADEPSASLAAVDEEGKALDGARATLADKLTIANGSLDALLRGKESQSGNAVRGPDVTLFAAVSDRYRRTELFRRARVSTVPLRSFEARLFP